MSHTSRILYVEDLETDQALLPSILSEDLYSISIAVNGQEAVERLKSEKFDLVLMDIEMPVMDGMEATRIIRNELNHDNDDLPILALTIHNTQETRNQALEVGIDDFIPKPFDQGELLEKLDYWINGAAIDSFAAVADMFNERDLEKYLIIDPKQIESFLQFIGLSRTKELIQDFIKHYNDKASLILGSDTDADTIAKELHAMASISGNIGLSRFSMACRFLMDDLKYGDIPERSGRLDEIQALYSEGLVKLNQILDVMENEA